MSRPYDLSTPGGRAAYLIHHHYEELVARAPGPCPSALSRATAEDAVQEVLQAIAEGRGRAPSEPRRLLGYAVVATRRTNARMVHDLLAAPVALAAAGEPVMPADPAAELANRSDALARLRHVVLTAGEGPDRTIAVLHLLGHPRDEIAAALGQSPRHVRRVVERCHRALSAGDADRSGRSRRAPGRYDRRAG